MKFVRKQQGSTERTPLIISWLVLLPLPAVFCSQSGKAALKFSMFEVSDHSGRMRMRQQGQGSWPQCWQ